jgi:hypothetical protein
VLQIPAIVIRTSASPSRRGTAESASFSLLSSKRSAFISTLIRQSRAVFKLGYWLFAHGYAMLPA